MYLGDFMRQLKNLNWQCVACLLKQNHQCCAEYLIGHVNAVFYALNMMVSTQTLQPNNKYCHEYE
jgi:hypothetical protein